VSNLNDGTVSVFAIQGKTVTPAGTVEVGGEKAGGGQVQIAPDGKTALVSRGLDHKVSVLSIDGTKVEYTKRDMTAGVRPIVLDIAPSGAYAVVGSLAGAASGDHDSISLIDLTVKPPRVVDTIGVLGATAEGLKISPDGTVVAVVVHNGSNRAKDSPFYNDAGKLVMVRVAGRMLSRVAEAPIGRWSQGVAFTPDGKTLLVGNMIEKDYWVLQWDGQALRDTGQRVKMNGGPAAIRTAEK
jgi:DNA-binding beta-propeller fold protein YncE